MSKQVRQHFHPAFKKPTSNTSCASEDTLLCLLMHSFHTQLSSVQMCIILLFPGIFAEETFHLEQLGILQNQNYLLYSAVLSLFKLGNRVRLHFFEEPGFPNTLSSCSGMALKCYRGCFFLCFFPFLVSA